MLSGSVAMGIYVIPRATRDFDIVALIQEKDIDDFAKAFKTGFYCEPDAIKDAIKNHGLFNIIDFESGYKADFVILKNTEYRQEEFSRRKAIDFWGKQIYVVTAEDLLLSKLIWIQDLQSSIQQEDIRQLAQLENLDIAYIHKWINKLQLQTFNLL
ncbi:hypothetical protein [Niabella sp.]|uniref:hypothetical protein n=1 Tax=Niabella sp. TaxID=1962976 RepID=UPI00262223BC|nr:hypothetical protein [Niabella sp.]